MAHPGPVRMVGQVPTSPAATASGPAASPCVDWLAASRPGGRRRGRSLGWLAAACCAAAIVKGTRIGPVVWVVSEQRGWGVHTGDALAILPVAVAGLLHLRLRRLRRSA